MSSYLVKHMNEKKVLLVDEEKIILDTYSFLLSKEGYRVVATNSGRKALKELGQQSFDIVITDLAIKNENGCTVLEEVKTMFPIIPVIVLTNNLSEIVKQFASMLGACSLIEKPFSYEILISCIRSFLTRSKSRMSI